MKPDFICIGATKAGTSWLYYNLARQPEFSLLPIKELHYFDRSKSYPSPNTLSITSAARRVCDYRYSALCAKRLLRSLSEIKFREAYWWMRYSFIDYSDSWYLSLFELEHGITGDITPAYSMLNEVDVAHMHATCPDSKIIFMIRNPIDRAWSMYRFREKLGGKLDLNDLNAFIDFVESPSQVLRSDYIRTIDLYSRYYDSQSMLIGFYDAISADPNSLLSEIMQHVGARKPVLTNSLNKIVNQSIPADIPDNFYEYLKAKYTTEIKELAMRYGSYANKWYLGLSRPKVEQAGDVSLFPPVVHP